MVATRRIDSLIIPRVSGSCLQTEPIERGCDLFIRVSNRHLPHHFNRIHACAPSVLTRAILLDSQF